MDENTETEETALTKYVSKTVGWTKREILVVAMLSQICFVDGVEFNLPGVITQIAGCQLDLSEIAENMLGVSFYVAVAIAIIFGGVLENKIGSRKVVLLSLHMSSISIIICAILPDFYTLILARAMIGLGCGIHYAAVATYNGYNVTKKNRKVSKIILEVLTTVGCTWIPLFGYLVLDRIGWRIFIVLSSLPFFVGPLVLLHICIPEESNEGHDHDHIPLQLRPKASVMEVACNTRVLKKSFLEFGLFFIGYGSVLLFPVLIRYSNSMELEGTGNQNEKCDNAVQGMDLMFLTIAGIGNIIGRLLTYFIIDRVSFRLNLLVHCSIIILCLTIVTIFKHSLVVVIISMSLVKLSYSSAIMEIQFLSVAVEYFGTEYFETMNVISQTVGMIGGALGVVCALFVSPAYATLAPLIMIGVTLGIAMSITDYTR